MLDFLKRKKLEPAHNTAEPAKSLLVRLKEGLTRTRAVFSQGLSGLFAGRTVVDSELLDELEAFLIAADVGVGSAEKVIRDLTARLPREPQLTPAAIQDILKTDLKNILQSCEKPLVIPEHSKPFVILMVGVNGAGKTTTIGKLAKKFQVAGKNVLLAAGDTFRAAAVDQLKIWGERNQIPVIAQQLGADSASVIFDAFQAAKARGVDVLLADTAGRLHTQASLMEELKKIVRVIRKIDETAPHEILLVLDASIGQNALSQAKKFHEDLQITGLALTKLDGTARGGIIFNIANTLNIPIRFVGVGEGIDDLKDFDANTFVEALFVSDYKETR